jgi:hypothetical protein
LVVFRSPFTIKALNRCQGLPEDFPDTFRSRLVRLPLPMETNQIIPKSFLVGKTILFQVAASKFHELDKRVPLDQPGLENASIMVFGEDAVESLSQAMKLGRQCAAETYKDGEHEVIVLPEYENLLVDASPVNFYFSSPGEGLLICASSREMMRAVLLRIGDSKPSARRGHLPTGKMLPAELPEWTLLDRQADIWCLRHYDKKTAELDHSSYRYVFVFAEGEPSYCDESPGGLVFTYSRARKEVKISFLSGDPKAQELRLFAWRHSSNVLPAFKASQSGSVLTITFDIADATASQCRELAVRIWLMLGFENALFNNW